MLFRSLVEQTKQAGALRETPTRPMVARLALLVHPTERNRRVPPMLTRLSLCRSCFWPLGLAACDLSAHHHSGGRSTHVDAAFTPRDPASRQPLDERSARDKALGHCRDAEIAARDGASFVVVPETEARDSNRVVHCHNWYERRPVTGADTATVGVDASYADAADACDSSGARSAGRRVVAWR